MNDRKPPRWAARFLKWFCAKELIEEIQGDLNEAYHFRRQRYSKWRADLWFISDVCKFFKPYSFEKHSRSKQFLPMFKNYFKVAARNLLCHKLNSSINLLGLSVGISSVLLLGSYIHYERTYDDHFPDSEKIYRLVNDYRDQTYTCMKFNDYYGSSRETQMRLINHLRDYDGVVDACHFVPNVSALVQ